MSGRLISLLGLIATYMKERLSKKTRSKILLHYIAQGSHHSISGVNPSAPPIISPSFGYMPDWGTFIYEPYT